MSRAALRLGYTQSAVSQQLAALERMAGVPLVVRSAGARTATLTEAGQQLVRHADAVRDRLAAARVDMAAFAAGSSGTVRVGAIPSVAAALVPSFAQELRGRAPGVVLHLAESSQAGELLARLGGGRLDLVLAAQAESDAIAAVELLRDPYVLLVARGDRLAGLRRPVRASDLQGRELIGKDTATASQQAAEDALAALGIATTTHIRAQDATTVHRLVAANLGIAIVPRLVVQEREPGVCCLPLGHLVPDRRIALHWRRDATPAPCVIVAREIAVAVAASAADRAPMRAAR